MTIEEAIAQLENLKKCEIYLWSKDIQAIDMAIKALEENDTLKTEIMAVKSGSEVLKICKLEEENAELKRPLRLAVEDLSGIDGVCDDYDDVCDECPCKINILGSCKWKHADAALKLLGDESDD